jgi:hypothetical protein
MEHYSWQETPFKRQMTDHEGLETGCKSNIEPQNKKPQNNEAIGAGGVTHPKERTTKDTKFTKKIHVTKITLCSL